MGFTLPGQIELTPEDKAKINPDTDTPVDPLTGASSLTIENLLASLLSGGNPQGVFDPTPGFRESEEDTTPRAGRSIGELGDFPVGQVDVRTPLMQALEMAAAPLLINTLLNPTGTANTFSNIAGNVPGVPHSPLSSFLFRSGDVGASAPALQAGNSTVGQAQAAPPLPQVGQPLEPVASDPSTLGMRGTDIGSFLGGGQVPLGAPGVSPQDAAGLLAQFGMDPNSLGITGLVPFGGTELNLGAINQGLNPQGMLLGAQHPAAPDFAHILTLLGGDAGPQDFTDLGALTETLNAAGIDTRAFGGPLDPNKMTLVGEQGPELLTPAIGGQQQVLPLGGVQTQGAPTNSFRAAPEQGPGTGAIQQLLQQNPEGQAFNTASQLLMDPAQGILGAGGGGQGVVDALRPQFQQNLQFGLNELTNAVPSVRNSGAAIAGADLTSRALNDFNVLAAQALQQGQSNTLGGLGLLGQLASSAGGGQFGRALQAGQLSTQRDLGLGSLGLQAQQQAFNQAVNPTLQLLLAAMGMATPTAFQTVVPGKK